MNPAVSASAIACRHEGDQGAGTTSRQFPNAGATAAGAVDCCTASAAKCPGNDARYNGAGWVALNFSLPDPYNDYPTYVAAGTNSASTFVAGATGDLDCDDSPNPRGDPAGVFSFGAIQRGAGLDFRGGLRNKIPLGR